MQHENEEKHCDESRIDVIAHRGASGYAPENTMGAFQKAVDMKANWLELDVRLNRDGELVVIHDATLDRTTDGTGDISQYSMEELQQRDAGSWFDPAYSAERIPLLHEVLETIPSHIGILIELKHPSQYPGMAKKLVDCIQQHSQERLQQQKVIAQSFEEEVLIELSKLQPDLPLGILIDQEEKLIGTQVAAYAKYCSFTNPSQRLVNQALVQQIHQQGMKIYTWTVRKREQVQPLIDIGVDGIITDFPDYVV